MVLKTMFIFYRKHIPIINNKSSLCGELSADSSLFDEFYDKIKIKILATRKNVEKTA